jgi:tripartite-type tricarboxylate transporter receptor subunit TctC
MKLPRRQFLHLAAGAAALPTVSDVARAQSYPTRPVRIIVGAAPSGTYDIMARLIGGMAVGAARSAIRHRK